MAKAQGIIGNFKGKIGNTVGYQLTSSNNKQTQGIRIYQPNVKNPKTSAQAEQRAKLAPINATYRALKMIIDRGNEGLPYGNKSRLAWLKKAFNPVHMPWFEKGASVISPVLCELTRGSLSGFEFSVTEDGLLINCPGATSESTVNTVGTVSTLLMAAYPSLKEGDQITIVHCGSVGNTLEGVAESFILNKTSADALTGFSAQNDNILFEASYADLSYSIIVSREGSDGEHLRSTSILVAKDSEVGGAPYNEASKTAAIESYMASGAANTDWAEESIQ